MTQIPLKDQKTLFLIDGSGFIFRAFHALPPLSRKDGTPVGAVFGFTNMVMKLINKMQPSYFAVVLDAGRYTFRNEIYENYKKNRADTPEDLIPQFPLIREACHAFNIPILEKKGFEADDVIATYATRALDNDFKVVVVSSDKDLMQLLTSNESASRLRLYDPIKSKYLDAQSVFEKFGVLPESVRDVMALIGDSSDNIPGVPGIGPKTAALLIDEFKSLENLLTQVQQDPSKITKPKLRENLQVFADQARLSYQLVSLDHYVDHETALEDLKFQKPPLFNIADFLRT